MSTRDGWKIFEKTRAVIGSMGWEGVGKVGIGTIAMAFFVGAGELVATLLSVPTRLINMMIDLVIALNEGSLGGLAGLFGAAFDAGIASFGTGWLQFLGIFQTPFGVGVALLTLWEVMYFMDWVDTDVLGFVIDLPDVLFNSDDSGVVDEDE